jgi:hypothetical protein
MSRIQTFPAMIFYNSPFIVSSHNKLNWDKAFEEPRVNHERERFEVVTSALGADFI